MTKCPTCGNEIDGATHILKDYRPSIGDIALCANCAEVLEYDKQLNLQVASLARLMKLTPKNHLDIELAQKLIRKQERKP